MYIEARPFLRIGATVSAWITRKGATVSACTTLGIHRFFVNNSRSEIFVDNSYGRASLADVGQRRLHDQAIIYDLDLHLPIDRDDLFQLINECVFEVT